MALSSAGSFITSQFVGWLTLVHALRDYSSRNDSNSHLRDCLSLRLSNLISEISVDFFRALRRPFSLFWDYFRPFFGVFVRLPAAGVDFSGFRHSGDEISPLFSRNRGFLKKRENEWVVEMSQSSGEAAARSQVRWRHRLPDSSNYISHSMIQHAPHRRPRKNTQSEHGSKKHTTRLEFFFFSGRKILTTLQICPFFLTRFRICFWILKILIRRIEKFIFE